MKRYRFSLERVRHWRGTQVDIESAALQKLIAELGRIDTAVRDLDSQLGRAESIVMQAAREGQSIDARRLADLDDFRLYVKREKRNLAVKRIQVQQKISQQRVKLAAARRAFRLLDRLRDRTRADWERQYAREVENEASDLYLAKWTGGRTDSGG